MYDVMCGDVWENVTKRLSQKIAGESRGEQIEGRHWQRFARECGLNPRQVLDRVSALAKSAVAKAEEAAAEVAVMPVGPHAILSQTQEAVRRRATTLLEQLQNIGETTPVENAKGAAGSDGPKLGVAADRFRAK
jgi:serine/threonine-protein kinase HipA